MLVEQLEVRGDAGGERRVAAADNDGREEQVELVDQAGLDRLGGELWTADAEVAVRRRLYPPHRLRIEVALDPRPGAGNLRERSRIHDLVGRLPYAREVLHDRPLIGEGLRVLP